jgi:glycosyltransferase involved in cell wall biosynthesis
VENFSKEYGVFSLLDTIKVIHISTGHDGGAGNAARRLNASLNKLGVNSQFVSLSNNSYQPVENEIEIERNLAQKMVSGVNARLQAGLSKKFFFSVYSFNVLGVKKIKKLVGNGPAILHIHNWFNLLNQKEIHKLLKIGFPVVITLHDERFYTGGCHHAFECQGYVNDCSNCPQISKLLKYFPARNLSNSLSHFQDRCKTLHVVAPSKWIFKRAKSSQLLRSHEIYFIPNTLGEFGQLNTRHRFPNLVNPKIIGIANVDLNSHLKGADIVKSLQERIDRDSLNYELVFLNSDKFKGKSQSYFWEMIDLLLVPSRADNSPNIIHEAKCMGIPVIASLVGGISELLDPNFDESIPVQNLDADFILSLLKNWKTKDKTIHLKNMHSNFEAYAGSSIQDHISLYVKLASSQIS